MSTISSETKKPASMEQKAMKVSKVSIAVNLALSAFKLLAGIIAHSGAMVSDGIHSASDVLSTFVVIVGVKISGKKSDEHHQFGHERMECVASIILAVLLCLTGIGIGREGLLTIISGEYADLAIPGLAALLMAVISIAVKEWMFWYTRGVAQEIHSGALMADAWHHRSDALSSIGAFAGILGARMGYPVLDSVASMVICVFIVKAAYEIFKDAIDKMVDRSCDEETTKAMERMILSVDGVERLDVIRTRLFGSKVFAEIEIGCDGNSSLIRAHEIAEDVHHTVEEQFPLVKHCMVHVNPIILEENKKDTRKCNLDID